MKTCDDCYFKPNCYSYMVFYDMDGCGNFKHKEDVVEVIRCGKCRHHLTRSGRCVKNEGIFSVSDFCSKGELK